MATLTEHKPGDFCWMELATTDQQAAKTFYGNLLGWTALDNPMGPTEVYTMFELGGRATGGGYRVGQGSQMPEIPPHWDIYIAVSSTAETAGKAAEAGGMVLKGPFDVMTYGVMAVIQDPTGAIFCIWEAKQQSGIAVKNENGAFCWADLNTPDPTRAREFYEKVFGWSIEGQESEYLHIKNGDAFIGGIPPAAYHQPGVPAHWMLYFKAADCGAETQKAADLGAKVMMPALSMPNVGTISVLADPQGAGFALYESVSEPANAATA